MYFIVEDIVGQIQLLELREHRQISWKLSYAISVKLQLAQPRELSQLMQIRQKTLNTPEFHLKLPESKVYLSRVGLALQHFLKIILHRLAYRKRHIYYQLALVFYSD